MAYTFRVSLGVGVTRFEPVDEYDSEYLYYGGGFEKWRAHVGRVPKVLRQRNDSKPHDFFTVMYRFGVSQRFREIVEEFEPGVHRFDPIELLQKNGKRHEGSYFLFGIGQRFDCLITTPPQTRTLYERGEYTPPYYDISPPNRQPFQVSRPRIAGRHFWDNGLLKEGDSMMSDAVVERLKKEKIKKLEIYPNIEVDEHWDANEQMPGILAWYDKGWMEFKAGVKSKTVSSFAWHLLIYPDAVLEARPAWLKEMPDLLDHCRKVWDEGEEERKQEALAWARKHWDACFDQFRSGNVKPGYLLGFCRLVVSGQPLRTGTGYALVPLLELCPHYLAEMPDLIERCTKHLEASKVAPKKTRPK